MEYSYLTGKEQLRYSMADGVLCVATASGTSVRLCITNGGVTVKKVRTFSRWFFMGFGGFAVPLFSFSVIAANDGVQVVIQQITALAYSNIILVAMLVGGLAIAIIHWRPIPGYRYTCGKDGINVWRDPTAGEHFSEFITKMNEGINTN